MSTRGGRCFSERKRNVWRETPQSGCKAVTVQRPGMILNVLRDCDRRVGKFCVRALSNDCNASKWRRVCQPSTYALRASVDHLRVACQPSTYALRASVDNLRVACQP